MTDEQGTIWDLGQGTAAKEAGQARTLAAVPDEWRDKANRAMLTLILRGDPFSADDLVRMVGLPRNRNAVGALFGVYSKKHTIRPCGRRLGNRKARHAGAQLLWVAK